ncbi:unnamed protein product, partial [Mesorhabditis spiculigera]
MMFDESAIVLILPIVFTIFLCIGSAVVILFLTILIYGWSSFKDSPFYEIVVCVTVVDLLHMLLQWFQTFPKLMFPKSSFAITTWLDRTIIGPYGPDTTDQALHIFVFLISLNRFAVFVVPKLLIMFTRRTMPLTISACLIFLGGLMFLRSMGPRRQLTNDPRDQHPPDQPPPPMETTARPFNIVAFLPTVIQYGMPLISLVFYVLIYLELRQQRQKTTTTIKNHDKTLLLQVFIESVLLEMVRGIDLIPPLMDGSPTATLLDSAKFMATVCSHALNSIFFLAMNHTVHTVLRSMQPCFSRTSKLPLSTLKQVARPSQPGFGNFSNINAFIANLASSVTSPACEGHIRVKATHGCLASLRPSSAEAWQPMSNRTRRRHSGAVPSVGFAVYQFFD